MTYQNQIKSPKWQKKRLEVLELRRFKCEECQSTEKQLHVHHIYYKKGKKIWDYEDYEFRCLCDDCHSKTHDLNDLIVKTLGVLETVGELNHKEQVLGYIDGILSNKCCLENPSELYMQGYIDGCSNIDVSERFKALQSI